jgi:hypothetical protein
MARSPGNDVINSPLLCLKLVFVMGVPWVLGLFVTFFDSPYLQYTYVILNSLQGKHICIVHLCDTKQSTR